MGFYAPAQIVRDVREHGVEVRPVDVNLSDWDATLEPGPRAPSACMRSIATWRTTSARRTRCAWACARSRDWREDDAKLIVRARGARLHFRARSLAAHRTCRRTSSSGLPTPMPSARSASPGARRCGPPRRSAASATRTTICRCFAVNATQSLTRMASRNDHPSPPSPRKGEASSPAAAILRPAASPSRTAAHAARRGGRQRLPLPRTVAARASGLVPARRPRPARHHPQRGAAHAAVRRARHRLRPRHHPPAAGLGQWRHLHDHRGRDARSPTSSSGRRRSSASARSSWARAMSR